MLASVAAAQSPAPAQSAPAAAVRFHISIECAPPVWIEGTPLKVVLHIENTGAATATIPAAWLSGESLILREIKPETKEFKPATIAYRPKTESGDRSDAKLPGMSRLSIQCSLDNISPPPGDAFDLFFMSEKPAAWSEPLRIERVEDLRGARAVVETDMGNIVFELAPESAPLAVRNFLKLTESKFYDGQAFHRIAKSLCIQTGDPESKIEDISTIRGSAGATFDRRPLPLERTRANFEKGSVGLARRHDELYQQIRAALATAFKVDTDAELDRKLKLEWPSALLLQENPAALTSGTSQFFICTENAPQFVGRYAVFAKVVDGMPVVKAIEAGETFGPRAGSELLAERPVKPVRIKRIWIDRKPKASPAAVPVK